MMLWFCRFGFHKWTEVKKTHTHNIVNDHIFGIFFPTTYLGERKCTRCGQIQKMERYAGGK